MAKISLKEVLDVKVVIVALLLFLDILEKGIGKSQDKEADLILAYFGYKEKAGRKVLIGILARL